MNRDHSVVFEFASKYCILNSLVDHDGYSISSEGFLPAVVDIMVIWVKFKWKTMQKICPFHYRGLECKSRKSRNTWSNRQIWPWSTEWSRAKTNRVLSRERTGHSKHPLPTIQEKTLYMDITRWSTSKSDWLYSLQPKMEKLYAVSKNKKGRWLWLRSWTPYC